MTVMLSALQRIAAEEEPLFPRFKALLQNLQVAHSMPTDHLFQRLPHTVWSAKILPALDNASRVALRSSCKAGRTLCDALTTCASLELPEDLYDVHLGEEALPLLSRLPGLTTLTLGSPESPVPTLWLEVALVLSARKPVKPLPCVQQLCLAFVGPMSDDVSLRLTQLLPGLRKVELVACEQYSDMPTTLGRDLAANCPDLTKVVLQVPPMVLHPVSTMADSRNDDAVQYRGPDPMPQVLHGLQSLAGLTDLAVLFHGDYHYYQLPIWELAYHAPPAMAALIPLLPKLQHLDWGLGWSWDAVSDLWVTHMTALTSFTLGLEPYTSDVPSPRPLLPHAGAGAAALARLTHLRMPYVTVSDPVWHNVLGHLPALSVLQVRRMRLSGPPTVQLPSVRELCFNRYSHQGCSPIRMLHVLRAMPKLATVSGGSIIVGPMSLEEPFTANYDSLCTDLAELDRLMGGLACPAPVERAMDVTLYQRGVSAMLDILLQVLGPLPSLGRRVTFLAIPGPDSSEVAEVDPGALARAFGVCFRKAEEITFHGFEFTNVLPMVNLFQISTLRRLAFSSCSGLSVSDYHLLACLLSQVAISDGPAIEMEIENCEGISFFHEQLLESLAGARPHVSMSVFGV